MGWLSTDAGAASNFLLGRPGLEMEFSMNPEAISIEDQAIGTRHRVISGRLKKSILNPSMPIIKINSKYLTMAQRNQISSLTMIDDTFLSFQTRDDWQVLSLRVFPQSVTQVLLPKMSCLNLSKVLVDGGYSSTITINALTVSPNPTAGNLFGEGGFGEGGFAGPDYYEGGSYDDSDYTINLGSSLPSVTEPVYVTFTYKGWLVDIEKFGHNSKSDFIDWFEYGFQLTPT